MKNFILILVLLLFFSCKEKKEAEMPTVEGKNLKSTQIDSILQEFQFEYEDPIVVDSSASQMLIPLSVV